MDTSPYAETSLVTGGGCPCCGSGDTMSVYDVDRMPVHPIQIFRDRDQALACMTGEMRLTFCRGCGFVWNRAFDMGLIDYFLENESTQSYSPTFNRFAERLAKDLVERFDLRHKRLIEIGCGQGEFLKLLSEIGDNEATGFDPSYHGDPQVGKMRFVQDYYSESYASVPADFVCCKMTLEHIPDAFNFVSRIRRTVATRPETVVFFQIPDIDRILEDRGFWDIYYEHCSYYSAGSLARLFRRSGYQVINVWRDYGDQYLMIEARPATVADDPLPIEETVAALEARVTAFSRGVDADRTAWRALVRDAAQRGRKPVIWGGGSKGVTFLQAIGIQDEVAYAVDINPNKSGTFLPGVGQEVILPEVLTRYRPDLVILMNPIYRDEVAATLRGLGLSPELAMIDGIAKGSLKPASA